MRRVIYISRSRLGEDSAELDAIVAASSVRNAAVGISGMLWPAPGAFVQALEGGHNDIDATMRRIAADPRHTDLQIICDRAVRSRMFGTWGMVFPDQGSACTAGTAYLVGYAGRQPSKASRRIVEALLSNDGFA